MKDQKTVVSAQIGISTKLSNSLLTLLTIVLVSGTSACTGNAPAQLKAKPPETVTLNRNAVADGASQKPSPPAPAPASAQLSAQDVAVIQNHSNYPELTVILAVQSVQSTVAKINSAGGRVLYDPNRGRGNSIPFLVATLSPKLLLSSEFISSLNLKAASVQAPHSSGASHKIRPAAKPTGKSSKLPLEQLYIPVQEVRLPQLRAISPQHGLGENTIVAVLDSGVDASHSAFQNRVIYWADHTQEGRIDLTGAPIKDGKIDAPGLAEIALPEKFKGNDFVYLGVISEQDYSTQLSDDEKSSGTKGFDLDQNGEIAGTFVVLAGKDATSGEWVAYVDSNGDGVFDSSELNQPIMDFNHARALSRKGSAVPFGEMLRFTSLSRTIAYPLIFDLNESGVPSHLTVGFDRSAHGTHVAGIIGANSGANSGSNTDGPVGAAPKAEIMSLKVCAGGCSDEALLRALIDLFYNPQGYIPDVVNISLASPQENSMQVMDMLIQDLAQKFGATFVIANGNSGPAYRTSNGFGSFAPVIHVGASVSKQTLAKVYSAPTSLSDLPEMSLFPFSSIGPSYSGALMPNIVAPGAALSPTPLNLGGYEVMQGTSMASPLTSGAIAGMISLARSKGLLEKMDATKAAKVAEIRNLKGEASSTDTLVGLPLLVRTALENSARPLAGYTFAEEGYGLLQIDAAFEKFKSGLKHTDGLLSYSVQLTINDDSNDKKVYDRDLNPTSAKKVHLGLRNDGEMKEETRLHLLTTPILVKLEKVQVQDSDGKTQELRGSLPFSIGQANGQGSDPTQTWANLANEFISGFYSIRHLNAMQIGKTYLAQYGLYQNEVRIQTILDVVHRPILLGDTSSTIVAPGIQAGAQSLAGAYAATQRTLAPTQVHHYFVALTPRDAALRLSLGMESGSRGAIEISVCDPDGQSVSSEIVALLPDLGLHLPTTQSQIPLAKTPKGDFKYGIYEVTVANAIRQGIQTSQYDLILQSIRLKPSQDHVEIATRETSTKAHLPSSVLLSLMNSSQQFKMEDLKLGYSSPVLMESITPFPVMPNSLVLKRIHIPPIGPDDEQTVTSVQVDGNLGESRIDHHLYRLKKGQPQIAYTANNKADPVESAMNKVTDTKVFEQVERPSQGEPVTEENALYIAVETISLPGSINPATAGSSAPTVEVTYDVPASFGNEELQVEPDQQNSSADVIMLSITAPNQIQNENPELKTQYGPKARSILEISGGSNDTSVNLRIPITIYN